VDEDEVIMESEKESSLAKERCANFMNLLSGTATYGPSSSDEFPEEEGKMCSNLMESMAPILNGPSVNGPWKL
jgi:hypothetical protein